MYLCTIYLKRNIAGKVKLRDKKQVMAELRQMKKRKYTLFGTLLILFDLWLYTIHFMT